MTKKTAPSGSGKTAPSGKTVTHPSGKNLNFSKNSSHSNPAPTRTTPSYGPKTDK